MFAQTKVQNIIQQILFEFIQQNYFENDSIVELKIYSRICTQVEKAKSKKGVINLFLWK